MMKTACLILRLSVSGEKVPAFAFLSADRIIKNERNPASWAAAEEAPIATN